VRTGPVVTEVRVSQSTLGRHPGLRIKQQHFLQQVQRQGVNLRYEILQVSGLVVDEVVPQHRRVLRPGGGGRGAEHLEDLGQLVRLVLPGEQGGLPVELGKMQPQDQMSTGVA